MENIDERVDSVGLEQTIYKVHRDVLEHQLPDFGDLQPEPYGDIVLADIKPRFFKALLRYLYLEEITQAANTRLVHELLKVARRFNLDHLIELCAVWLELELEREHTDELVDTVSETFQLAVMYQSHPLEDDCIQALSILEGQALEYLVDHEDAVVATDEYKALIQPNSALKGG